LILKTNLVIGLFVCLVLAQACRQQSDSLLNLSVAHEVSPQPPQVGQVTITLNVTDVARKPATGARITLEGNMSHPGMVPVFADARETMPGRYVSTMELSMAGDWYVIARVSLPDSRRLDHQFEIKGVAQPKP
jgi:hypothetical protein